jgi:hypothetical protein
MFPTTFYPALSIHLPSSLNLLFSLPIQIKSKKNQPTIKNLKTIVLPTKINHTK